MSEPRRHHYCPAGYLANFATPCERDGKLIATDASNAQERPSTPDNEAHQRDFYRIEVQSDKDDPFVLEKEFGKIEAPGIAAIKRVISSNRLPSGDDLNWIINFIGLLAVRVPSKRDRWKKFEQEVYRKILQMS